MAALSSSAASTQSILPSPNRSTMPVQSQPRAPQSYSHTPTPERTKAARVQCLRWCCRQLMRRRHQELSNFGATWRIFSTTWIESICKQPGAGVSLVRRVQIPPGDPKRRKIDLGSYAAQTPRIVQKFLHGKSSLSMNDSRCLVHKLPLTIRLCDNVIDWSSVRVHGFL